MIRRPRFFLALVFAVALAGRFALADYDPPPTYYTPAAGLTGIALKQKLNAIIDATNDPDSVVPSASEVVATPISYDAARSALQMTDADTAHPGHIITVYDRTSLDVSSFLTNGVPGWNPNVWNREHTWPRSRGVDSSGPDDSDLFGLRPALNDNNGDRGNLNFGGAFGAQSWGIVNDGGSKWYPGDADAGVIARQEFYMAVRYDGGDTNTTDLELFSGNPIASQGLGDLDRLLQWHYAAPPDTFERRRNEVVYSYQRNRNPFTDHPEYAWSIFVNQTNDSQLTLASPATVNTTTGASTKTINLTSVIVGGAVPGTQSVTLNKSGNNGTYYSVTTSGLATSTISGPLNAFRIITNGTDSKSFNVGLDPTITSTAAAGLRTGTVTIDNLDITAGSNGGIGHAANDANDVITVNLNVLDHAAPLFASNQATSLTLDFGNVALGDATPALGFNILNKIGTASFTAALDLDSFTPSGNAGAFTTSLAPFSSLAAGLSQAFTTSFIATSVGTFTTNFTLNLSDENLSGATAKTLQLTLTGTTRLAGDYNGDLVVDANDYVIWRDTMGQSGPAFSGADGDGNGVVTDDDYGVWRAHFGQIASAAGASLAAVPEPASVLLILIGCSACSVITGRRSRRVLRPRA